MMIKILLLMTLVFSSYTIWADEYFYVPQEIIDDEDGYILDTEPLTTEERKMQQDFEMQEEAQDEEMTYQIGEE